MHCRRTPGRHNLQIEGEFMADLILNRIATDARYIDLKAPEHARLLRQE
jgi:hypothetical protein